MRNRHNVPPKTFPAASARFESDGRETAETPSGTNNVGSTMLYSGKDLARAPPKQGGSRANLRFSQVK